MKILATPNAKTANTGNAGKYSMNEGLRLPNELLVEGFPKLFKPKPKTMATRTKRK